MSKQEEADKQFQIECLTKEIILSLMEEKGLTMEEAFDVLYNSHTYEKIENERTGLFYQSPVYVMDMLNEEFSSRT